MVRRCSRGIEFTLILLSVSFGIASGADWDRFRGPNGSGVSSDATALPTTFSETENLAWKVALPGPGSSCPIVVGDKVFVTCWSGYGTGRGDGGNQENLKRHLICLDRETGKIVWDRDVKAVLPEDEYSGMFAQHGYASHTPVSDGERVYVFFGKSGVLAFDLEGKQLWQTAVGTGLDQRGWGSASSPILYKDMVIVTASAESASLYGLNKATGEIVWQQEAPGTRSTWGSPILVPVDEKRTDLVLGVPYEIWGLNPETGGLRWFCEAMDTNSYCSSVVAEDGVVYGVEGQGGGSIALKVGGDDDITKTNVVWTGRHSNRIGTPVVHEGLLYFVANKVASCVDAKTGDRVAQMRLTASESAPAAESEQPGRGRGRGGFGGGQDYSSPVVGDGKLYYASRNGDIFVLSLGSDFKQLAANRLTNEREDFSASPAISDGSLFFRSDKHLYRVALDK